jgi:hypothetical protein
MDKLFSSLSSLSLSPNSSRKSPRPSDSPREIQKTKLDCANQLKEILVRCNLMDFVVEYLRELYKLNTTIFRCIHYRIIEKNVDEGYAFEGRLLEGIDISDNKFQLALKQTELVKKKTINTNKTSTIECNSNVKSSEISKLTPEVIQKPQETEKECITKLKNLFLPEVIICTESKELVDTNRGKNRNSNSKNSNAAEIESKKVKDGERQFEIKSEVNSNPNKLDLSYKIDLKKMNEMPEFTDFCMEFSDSLKVEPEQKDQAIIEFLKKVIELTFNEELEIKEKMLTAKITEWDTFWRGEVATKDYDNCEQKLFALQAAFIEDLCFLLHYQILMRLKYIEMTKPVPIEKSKPFHLSLHSSSGSISPKPTSPKSISPKESVEKK